MSRRCSLPAINKLSQQRVCFSSWTKGKKNYRAIKKMERSACRWRTWRTSLALLSLPPREFLLWWGTSGKQRRYFDDVVVDSLTVGRVSPFLWIPLCEYFYYIPSVHESQLLLLNHRIKLNPLTRFILLIHLHGMH